MRDRSRTSRSLYVEAGTLGRTCATQASIGNTVLSVIERLAVHVTVGAVVRGAVIAVALRRLLGQWSWWPEVICAAMSPVLLRALIGEGTFLVGGYLPVLGQIVSAPLIVFMQVITIRLVTDHERGSIWLRCILLVALAAQLAAQLISGPVSGAILQEDLY